MVMPPSCTEGDCHRGPDGPAPMPRTPAEESEQE